MTQPIPPSLERLQVLPFSFDERLGKFIVGVSRQIVNPNDLLDALRNKDYMLPQDVPSLSAGVVLNDRVITGPVFHDFVETEKGKEAIRETPKVMFSVFNVVNELKVKNNTIGGAFGFNARRFCEGQVDLSTLGSCACFGPEGHSFIIRPRYWKLKFAEYSGHNIDAPAQTISSYAGLGYIAGKAAEAAASS